MVIHKLIMFIVVFLEFSEVKCDFKRSIRKVKICEMLTESLLGFSITVDGLFEILTVSRRYYYYVWVIVMVYLVSAGIDQM